MFGFNKKSKKVSNMLLTKVIEAIQYRLIDLGDVTYDIERELSSTAILGKDASLLDKFFSSFFGRKAPNERLRIILYSRNDANKCAWTSISMDFIVRLASKDIEFVTKEFIEPTALKLRRAFEALKA